MLHDLARQALAAEALALALSCIGQTTACPTADVPERACVDAELASDLVGWAARLSGRSQPAAAVLPLLQPLPLEELARTVCPERPGSCRGLVAAYNTVSRRIVYRATLDMRNPTDQAFIVHELVHWLQHLERGDAIEDSCRSVLAAEREAYAVQNQYLTRFQQLQRVGEMLRFTYCDASADARPPADPAVNFDASTGPITATQTVPMGPPPSTAAGVPAIGASR